MGYSGSLNRGNSVNRSKTPRHIYIDCSGTFYTGFNTGIQRVVRNITIRSKKMEERYNIPVTPVIAIMGRFVGINPDNLSGRFYKGAKKTPFDRLSGYYLGAEKKIKINDKTPKYAGKNFKLTILANIRTGLKNIFQTGFFIYLFALRGFKFKPVKIGPNDLIFLPDTYWSFNVLSIAGKYKTKKGAEIITLVHDIIPVTYPQFYDSLRVGEIIRGINEMAGRSGGFICNSGYCADELKNYLKKRRLFKQIDYFYPGNDLGEKRDAGRPPSIRSDIKSILEHKNTYLMVGTIEPRKNHLFVLDIFEDLWNRGFSVNLIIAGAPGWNCGNILKRFRNSKYAGNCLFVYNDINDAELEYLYKNSKALIAASLAEGFGLPLVEAAGCGINVFASDIPVFREIGKDYPVYFSPDLKNDLAQKIISFERAGRVKALGKKENARPAFKWLSSDESADVLFNKILEVYDKINGNVNV